MFKQLYKEHLTLQKAFCNLYYHRSDIQNHNHKNVYEVLEENKKLEATVNRLQLKVVQLENELCKEKERCELLEFCFLELENQNQAKIPESIESIDCAVNTDLCWTQCSLLKSHGSWQGGHPSSCCWLHITSDDAPLVGYCCHCSSLTLMSMETEKLQKIEQSQKKLKDISKKLCSATKSDYGCVDREWCCVSEIVSSIGELQSLISWIAEKKGEKEENYVIAEKLQQLGRIRKVLEKSASESRQHLHDLQKESFMPYPNSLYKEEDNFCKECSPERDLNLINEFRNSFSCCNHNNIYEEKYESNQLVSESFADLSQENEDLHDSLGTAVSEDEGLGEESRRADSVGMSSLSEMSDHSSIVNDIILDAPLEFTDPISSLYKDQTSTNWINEKCQRNSVELCLAAVAKLKDSLVAKEKEITKLKAAKMNKNEIAELHLVVRNLQKNIDDLQSSVCILEKENSNLKEQVLELEEAENDARLQGQRLEEKLSFLQEKDSHFQVELAETKHALQLCLEELSLKDVEERELQSQLKFMEVLVQKYEEQIGQLESLRNNQNDFRLKDVAKKNIQTDDSKPNNVEVNKQNNNVSNASIDEVPVDLLQDQLKCHNICLNSSLPSQVKHACVQTDCNTPEADKNLRSCCVQTELWENKSVKEIKRGVDYSSEKNNTEGCSSVIQKELLARLHNLVEEDAHLQQQLYQVDQINLALWQKLHNLQFNIGECQRENVTNKSFDNVGGTSEIIPLSQSTLDSQAIKTKNEENSHTSKSFNSLDCSEDKLKDCLLHLEKTNAAFLGKLQLREKLYSDRENRQAEWINKDDMLKKSLKEILQEKTRLLHEIKELEDQKSQLATENETICSSLEKLKEKHEEKISNFVKERDEILDDIQSKINNLLTQEKECLKKMTTFKKESKGTEDTEFQNLKANYVQVQLDLVRHRDKLETMKLDFTNQLQSIVDIYNAEQGKLIYQVEEYNEKESLINKKLEELKKICKDLQDTFQKKENELEEGKCEFKSNFDVSEEEHKLLDNELQKILLQMEQQTAIATKALSEERIKLEKELRENISDLRSKEEVYKARIMELELNVSQLHLELQHLTEHSHAESDAGVNSGKITSFNCDELLNELQELRNRETDLKDKLDDMEKKEAAYKETLEHADRIVATVERGYKNKIEELEMSERSLKQRIGYLEEVENRLRMALQKERRNLNGRTPDDLLLELSDAEKRENSMKEKIVSLEQSQRTSLQRIKELEKIQEVLERQVNDYEELEISMKKLQQEHDTIRKELAKIKISESSLKVALTQTGNLLENRELEIKSVMKQFNKEKRDLEETITQLRAQVRELKQRLEKHSVEEEPADEILFQERPLCFDLQPSIYSSNECNEFQQLHEQPFVGKEKLISKQKLIDEEKFSPITRAPTNPNDANYLNNTSSQPVNIFSEDSIATEKSVIPEAIKKPDSLKTIETLNSWENSLEKPTRKNSATGFEEKNEACSCNSSGKAESTEKNFQEQYKTDNNQILKSEKCQSLTNKMEEKEYSMACNELEECMLRAIDVMEMKVEKKPVLSTHEGEERKVFHPPNKLTILQQIGSEAIIIGWEYADSSNLAGFELFVNNNLQERVYIPDRRKAVLSGLNLTEPLILGICAVSTTGEVSEMKKLDFVPALTK